MARTCEIETIETAFFVGKRRPLSDFPLWKQWLVRFIYFALGWSNGDAVEAMAICTDKALAEDMANKPGWFLVRLPINTPLPDEPCQFREHTFPHSEEQERYETERTVPVVAVRASVLQDVRRVEEQVDRLWRSTRAG